MTKKRECCPHRVAPARGAWAHTFRKSMPVSHGKIIDVSHDGRFVKVFKKYGRRCKWSEWFPIDEVHVYENKGSD